MMDLFKAIGLGLVVLLPLANPLTHTENGGRQEKPRYVAS